MAIVATLISSEIPIQSLKAAGHFPAPNKDEFALTRVIFSSQRQSPALKPNERKLSTTLKKNLSRPFYIYMIYTVDERA